MSHRPASFFQELKRRKVLRAASVYAGVAFATSEAADLVVPRLQLPDWTVTLVIVLALVGLPLVLVSAWIFDLREGTLMRSEPAPEETAERVPWFSTGTIGATALLLAVGATAGWMAGRATSTSDSSLASIAVLPFADMSPAGDMEYFGDGMAEEILNVLAKVPGLKVAGRTSSFSFKGRSADLRSIGAALGVGTILEGSVRRSETRMRITAQLIRADDQSHLWSETFDRGFDEDVFVVQDDIARAIVEALRLELTGSEAPSVGDERGTDDLRAYNAYLLGRFQWNRRTRDGVLGSIASFEEAIRLDPGYARAYTGMADAYAIASNFDWMSPHEAMPLARSAVDSALALDPDLADAHASLGAILSWYEWDQEAAERAFVRALELDPRSTFAHYWYSLLLDYTNRPEEALAQLNVALEADPLSLQVRNGIANHRQWHGDYEGAIDAYRAILAIDPDFHNARRWLATAYLEAGRPAEALPVLDSLPEGFTHPAGLRGWAFVQLGRPEDARRAFDGVPPQALDAELTYTATGLAKLGDLDAAYRLLDGGVARRGYPLLQIVFLPPENPVRLDPRFAGIVADLGLARYWAP